MIRTKVKFLMMCVFIAAAASHVAVADGRSDEIIAKTVAKIKSLGAYTMEFNVYEDGGRPIHGYLSVDGEKVNVKTEDLEMISDGKTRYFISRTYKEVTVDDMPAGEDGIFSGNPLHIFDFLNKSVSSSYAGEEEFRGKKYDAVTLKPTEGRGYPRIKILIDRGTSLPVRMIYEMEGGSANSVTIEKISKLTPSDNAVFRFDIKSYPGYEVIDLR